MADNERLEAEGQSEADGRFDAVVTATEPLSTKLDIRLETACGVSMVCRIGAAHSTREGRPIREGQQMPMYLDMARVHVFESGEAGRNLVPAGRAACGHGVGSSG